MVEEQDDASLPLGQTKVLREGQKGELVKKYQDVIVEGNVIASNLLSEDRKAPVNRLIAKGTLVEKRQTLQHQKQRKRFQLQPQYRKLNGQTENGKSKRGNASTGTNARR